MQDKVSLLLNKIYEPGKYTAIVAHGEFPKSDKLIELITRAQCIICCDGAIDDLLKVDIVPDHIIGDCDSLSEEVKASFSDRIIRIPEQDTNDLTKAVYFAKNELAIENIIIFAATGKREDHSLANISLLIEYAKLFKQVAILSDYGIFTLHNGPAIVKTLAGQQISLFSVDPTIKISSKGLVWELNEYQLSSWYKGTLNQAKADYFEILCNSSVIVYRGFDLKTQC